MKTLLLILGIVMLLVFPVEIIGQQVNAIKDSTEVYSTVDRLPYIKNHRKSLTTYIQNNREYPGELKLKGVEGVVIVAFVVDANGHVRNARVESGDNAELNELALSVVLKSGPWVAGKVKDQDVATLMSVPVSFKLNDDERKMMEALKPIDFENKPPLFVLDGKIVEGMVNLDFYNVRSIRVIKGAKAVDHYGERAQYGVVEITSKRGTPPVW
jgi:TonB family protein